MKLNNITIKQTKSEGLTSEQIDVIAAIANSEDIESTLEGTIYSVTGKCYSDSYDAIMNKYGRGWMLLFSPDIAESGRCFRFEDKNVEKAILLEQNLSDGISMNEIKSTTLDKFPTFKNNIDIVSFNEYKYFDCLSDMRPQKWTPVVDNTFSGCVNLTSVDISNLKRGGNSQFSNCTNLTSIGCDLSKLEYTYSNTFLGCTNLQIENMNLSNMAYLGSGTFQNCKKLNCNLLNLISIEGSIGGNCFYNCTQLSALLVIGKNCTTVQYGAFRNTKIKNVILLCDSVPVLQYSDAFSNDYTITFFAPQSLLEDYSTADNWKNYYSNGCFKSINGTEWVLMFGRTGKYAYYDNYDTERNFIDSKGNVDFEDDAVEQLLKDKLDSSSGISKDLADSISEYQDMNGNTIFLRLFLNNQTISRFDELKEFSNIKAISPHGWNDEGFAESTIESICLDNIEYIGANAFGNCANLKGTNGTDTIRLPKITTCRASSFLLCLCTKFELGETVLDLAYEQIWKPRTGGLTLDVVFKGTNPPLFALRTFGWNANDWNAINLHVPHGCTDAYRTAVSVCNASAIITIDEF